MEKSLENSQCASIVFLFASIALLVFELVVVTVVVVVVAYKFV